MYFLRFPAMDKSICRCRGAPSRPLTTAAAEKTVSGPGTETENRAVTETGRERGNGKEAERERESVIGHRINQWTHTIRCSPHTHFVQHVSILWLIYKSIAIKCGLVIVHWPTICGAMTNILNIIIFLLIGSVHKMPLRFIHLNFKVKVTLTSHIPSCPLHLTPLSPWGSSAMSRIEKNGKL